MLYCPPPNSPSDKRKRHWRLFLFTEPSKERMWSVAHWQSKKESVCAAYCCLVFRELQPVCSKKKPTTKPFGCGSYSSGPLARVDKPPGDITRMNEFFFYHDTCFMSADWRLEFWSGSRFFWVGWGEFRHIFCCVGASTLNVAGSSLCHSKYTCFWRAVLWLISQKWRS